jgi:hypothetical protein
MAIKREVPNSTLEEAFRRLREIVSGKKRRLTIKAGKSYLYMIHEEDLGRH